MNNDGKTDVVVIKNGGKNRTIALLGNGDGTLHTSWSVGTRIRVYAGGISLGDFNGDGKLDLAETYPPYRVTIRLGNGDGTFRDGPNYKTDSFLGPLEVADFSHDGILDIAALTINDTVKVLLGQGDGTFTLEPSYPLDPGSDPVFLIATDLNNDGGAHPSKTAKGGAAEVHRLNQKGGPAPSLLVSPLGLTIGAEQEWHWAIVEAKAWRRRGDRLSTP